ncbi:MAG: hypothetical protein ACXABK_03590 [Candidatus Heimdallarchaeaceae archaeon]|jgi:hypothetical protein
MSGEKNQTNNEGEMKKFSRASPFTETTIAEIVKPGRYRILVTVASIEENNILVSDETEEIKVLLPDLVDVEITEGKQLRILGYVELNPEKIIKAIIIQDFSDVSGELYRQVNELEKSLRKNT